MHHGLEVYIRATRTHGVRDQKRLGKIPWEAIVISCFALYRAWYMYHNTPDRHFLLFNIGNVGIDLKFSTWD